MDENLQNEVPTDALSVGGKTPVEGVDVNIPLNDTQKLTLTNTRLRRMSIQRQIAELETQDAKLEGFFHGELMKIAITNKIDMQKFSLSDGLDIKPIPPKGAWQPLKA